MESENTGKRRLLLGRQQKLGLSGSTLVTPSVYPPQVTPSVYPLPSTSPDKVADYYYYYYVDGKYALHCIVFLLVCHWLPEQELKIQRA